MPAPPPIHIRAVQEFEEPAYAAQVEQIFGDKARVPLLAERLDRNELMEGRRLRATLPQPQRLRMAAYAGDALVGWSSGWYEVGGTFYMASSAVMPEWRRQGIYSRLVQAIIEEVKSQGGAQIRSRHVASNNPVLIAKLKLGFMITGTEYSEELGLLVLLNHYLYPGRKGLFVERTTPFSRENRFETR
ncbi:GNAT family N-acetyltransferase [Parachitinimonas caeni]|uniref:GNAT family N-acetyltransferase n=1 Tax=Parachitinimonas caeni TaxID=3031301 RepID=A0ABT7DW11_9NEIS|nr:GNAT family N-acetyltransferase [Parachitinimonas caeni]MDK2124250.1 GNAT family N-acetyltransferase [Parachitinimonas caeni]